MTVSFAFAAQQRVKQSNIDMATEAAQQLESMNAHDASLIAPRQTAKLATKYLSLTNTRLAVELERFSRLYPPIPELEPYGPSEDESNNGQLLPFGSRPQQYHYPDHEVVA
jgi:hypothetical protein